MPKSLYGFIWQESGRQQVWLCLLTLLVVPLSTVPLELQRRIINDALGSGNARTLLLLCGLYLATILLQGGLKYLLNLYRGRVVGNTDEGRVFFTPYDEIALVYINRFVREDEVNNIFDSAAPPEDSNQTNEDPESALLPPAAIDALSMLLPTNAPGRGSDLIPRTLSTP